MKPRGAEYYRGCIILNKKGIKYLFYYMSPTRNKIWEDKSLQNTANFDPNTSLFRKN